jgi:hypothetical protein
LAVSYFKIKNELLRKLKKKAYTNASLVTPDSPWAYRVDTNPKVSSVGKKKRWDDGLLGV